MDQTTLLDISTLLIYLIFVIGISLFASRRKLETSEDYFLAGRNMGWFAVGVSLFVSSISVEHFVGMTGAAAANGIIVGYFEWMAIVAIFLLGWFIGPVYIKSGIFTIPEFLEKRFNRTTRIYLTSVSIAVYILTKVSFTIIAGGFLLNALLGWDIYTSALIIVLISGIYTIVGGLGTVIYTQMIQFIFLIVGTLILAFFGLKEIGGLNGLMNDLPDSYFSVYRPLSDPYFPWTGLFLGTPILAIWYWCTDQFIVQKVFAVRGLAELKKATLFTVSLKLFSMFLILGTGMIAGILFPEILPNEVHIVLLAGKVLPAGLTGLFLSGLLAAIMSTLASVFHSTATLITLDYYRVAVPGSSDRKLVLIGRLATMCIVICAALWIPVTKLINGQIFIYLLSVQAYLAPPIAAVIIFGLINKSVNGRGAVWSLATGGILGVSRLVLESIPGLLIEYTIIDWFVGLNFLHFSIFLFLISIAVLYSVSYLFHNGLQTASVSSEARHVSGVYVSQSIEEKELNQQIYNGP